MPELKAIQIEYVEEPLMKSDFKSMDALRRKTSVRVALDETLSEADHPETLLQDRSCDVAILKPTLLGGINHTLRLAHIARQHQIPIVLTSTFETECGLSALVHLAAALPVELLPCGLDTLRFFKSQLPAMFEINNGLMKVPDRPGLGFDPE
jgi:O-succinylbenzoate synthase